ncbi:hypothetical protein JXB37_07110, partial [candidate division WOR-3 bacterium]|nr:hypothetical protein [candidate division WOR-3 bacterium]
MTATARLGLAVLLVLSACEIVEPQPWQNHAPRAPSVSGPDSTFVGTLVQFQVTCYDPDGHAMLVLVAWGDGDTSDYGDFVPSEQTVVFEHSWAAAGSYDVKAWCRDDYLPDPKESGWS